MDTLMDRLLGGLLVVIVAAFASVAEAHAPSDSLLTVELAPTTTRIQWEIALRDLEGVVGLDENGDGALTWGEVRSRRAAIVTYAVARVHFTAADEQCRLTLPDLRASRRAERAYAVLGGSIACPRGGAPTRLEYRLLLDVDPTHRALVRIVHGERERALVLGEHDRVAALANTAGAPADTFASFWLEGMRHVAIGTDHVLFLIAILLPVASRGRRTTAVLLDTAALVTAFTIAHSVTLALAVLDVVSVPARAVESAIAFTVVLAAIDNVRPLFGRRRAGIAFGLGLVHGLGFAGALDALGLPPAALGLALLAFNLGVECAQLLLIVAVVPVACALRNWWPWQRLLVPVAAIAVAGVATLWLLERAFALGGRAV